MKIVVIEDQALVRGLIVRMCRDRFSCERLDEASDGVGGRRLVEEAQPDLVLMDLDLPDGDGLDLIEALNRVAPTTRIVALSAHTDEFTLHRVMQCNLSGFVDKNEQAIEALCSAIAEVSAGRKFFSPVVRRTQAALLSNPKAFTKLLSDREQELLRLFGSGLSNEDVAARLGLSATTVQNHRRNIMGKLGVHSAPQLIRYAIEKGFTRYRTQA